MLLARYGRELSFEEGFFRLYYEALDEWEVAMRGKRLLSPVLVKDYPSATLTGEKFAAIQKKLEERKETIVSIFMEAVDHHDGAKIINLARAVWFFKDKRHPNPPADRERNLLLFLKAITSETGEKLTIRQVAQFLSLERLAAGGKLEMSQDGYSALRRKCKQIGISLVESRKRSSR